MATLNMRKHSLSGRLIYVEGGEFAGKTTLIAYLAKALKSAGYSVTVTKEPTSSNLFGRTVRAIYQLNDPHKLIEECIDLDFNCDQYSNEAAKYLKEFVSLGAKLLKRSLGRDDLMGNPNLHMFLQLGMVFDRAQHHHDTIIPALKMGDIALSDRCSWSTLAYARANNIDWRYLAAAHNDILGWNFILPDVLLFLDVSIQVALERKRIRGSDELFEREEQMRKNLEVYYNMYRETIFPTAVLINADKTEQEVLEASFEAVETVLPPK